MEARTVYTTKSVVSLTLLAIAVIGVLDYLIVLKSHKSLYENLLLVLSLLTVSFFVFITFGLYRGARLKENIGNLTDHIDTKKLPDFGGGTPDVSTAMEGLGSIAEGLGGLAIAIVCAFVLIMLGWFFILSSWFLLIFLSAVLYGIYFRALRVVFKKSVSCRGDLLMSMKYGLLYSFLYSSWIFAFVVTLHYFT